jgi:hypothetical protein
MNKEAIITEVIDVETRAKRRERLRGLFFIPSNINSLAQVDGMRREPGTSNFTMNSTIVDSPSGFKNLSGSKSLNHIYRRENAVIPPIIKISFIRVAGNNRTMRVMNIEERATGITRKNMSMKTERKYIPVPLFIAEAKPNITGRLNPNGIHEEFMRDFINLEKNIDSKPRGRLRMIFRSSATKKEVNEVIVAEKNTIKKMVIRSIERIRFATTSPMISIKRTLITINLDRKNIPATNPIPRRKKKRFLMRSLPYNESTVAFFKESTSGKNIYLLKCIMDCS